MAKKKAPVLDPADGWVVVPPPEPEVLVNIGPDVVKIKLAVGTSYKKKSNRAIAQMMALPPAPTGILPPVVRSFSPDMRRFVVERKPFVTHMKYHAKSLEIKREFEIPIPWTIYYIELDESFRPEVVYIWCRPEQIYADDDKLYFLPMPNLYWESKTCLGNSDFGRAVVEEGGSFTIADGINQAINTFWTSRFNDDLESFVDLRPAQLGSGQDWDTDDALELFAEWETHSIADVLTWDYEEAKSWTLPQLLYEVLPFSSKPSDAKELARYINLVGASK